MHIEKANAEVSIYLDLQCALHRAACSSVLTQCGTKVSAWAMQGHRCIGLVHTFKVGSAVEPPPALRSRSPVVASNPALMCEIYGDCPVDRATCCRSQQPGNVGSALASL